MVDARFEDVVCRVRVGTRRLLFYERLCLLRRHAKIKDQIFARQVVDAVFQMLDPERKSARFSAGTRAV